MSSRKSSSNREDLSSSRYGERTPLRSLNNEILSTPSQRLKFKSQLSGDAMKMAMGGSPLCNSDPRLETHSSPADETQAGSGLGDVTFKSFICAGGEVEIAGSSVCTEGGLTLSEDAAADTTEAEDSAVSHSLMEPSCCDHVEHPYFSLDVEQPPSAGISAADVCEISSRTFSFCDVDNKEDAQDLQACHADCGEEKHVTLKSFVCYGGEVELSDTTKLHEETIPLPVTDFIDSSQHNNTHTINCSDCAQPCQAEHVDHPYCNSENGKAPDFTTSSETTLTELTLKPFNCTGAEVETSVCAEHIDETVPLPFTHTVSSCETYSNSVDPSVSAGDDGLQNNSDRLDNPHCTIKHNSINVSTNQEVFFCSSKAVGVEPMMESEGQDVAHEHSVVLLPAEDGKSDDNEVLEKLPPFQTQCGNSQPSDDSVSTSLTQDFIEGAESHLENNEVVGEPYLPVDTGCLLTNMSLKDVNNDKVKYEVQEIAEPSEDNASPSVVRGDESSDSSCLTASAGIPAHQEASEFLHYLVQECSTNEPPESSGGQDSALGSSTNNPAICMSTAKPMEDLHDFLKVLSECPSISSALQLGVLSPALKRASLSLQKAPGYLPQNRFLADKFALEGDKSLVSHVNPELSKLWTEQIESPMPHPLFNSTAVGCLSQPGSAMKQKEDSGKRFCALPQAEGVPLMPEAQLQQQLRQIAEFLILASGQMSAAGHSAPPTGSHSVCVGTSPAKLVDHSLNTSGTFVRSKELPVVDSCTETDPLVWNLSPGSLESLPRKELEQRLVSSLIMVEALAQQLTAARAQQGVSAGPAPSDLREKLVQTDHTELSQTTMYRDLYAEALSRISDLELDGSSLQNLIQSMQDTKTFMAALSGDTDAALSNMKEWRDIVREDHQNLASHYEHMKSLFEKSKEMQMRMTQKVKEVLHEREDMRTQMEEAFTAKDAAFCAMEQLRMHCAAEISALEKSVGSQKELLAALNQTYPEQVALNKTSSETLNAASDILSQTMEEHSSLMNELHSVRILLQKTAPILFLLNEKTAAALRERDEHRSARDRAVEDREQIEEELKETNLNLQSARQQIGDLTREVTILTSEINVLRQKLTEKEDETSQLERKVTELSATTSSTMASYTFLEQALIAETSKLEQSWKDIKQANERADQLEASLQESKERVCELTGALSQSEDHVAQLQTLTQSQSLQIQQLQDACAQLRGVQEMNEFLQMENELAQEQVAESERTLRMNLQALRERNIECEDLKEDFCKFQEENKNLCEELKTTRSAANAAQAELEEKMAQVVTEITLLHHTLRGVTNELHAALSDQKQDQKESEVLCSVERRRLSSSFVDSVMVALTAETGEDVRTDTSAASGPPVPQSEPLFSETSAFTLITAQASKTSLGAEEEQPCDVADLLSGLGDTASELVGALKSLQQRRDGQLHELHDIIRSLQAEQQTASSHHQAEVMELKHELNRLQNLAERGNQALQQKSLDEKTLTKLMADVQEAQEILNKRKTDNHVLQKEVVELRHTLQQSKVESQVLRDELRKSGGRSADAARYTEEKIQLVKEMERQKLKLQEAEQARFKLLERAKRHQIIHQTNMQKSETELQILNNMINKVRETLLSLPEVVKRCEQLQQLLEFIG
ncbi:sperm-associated antigen 5 [Austrofundulus limnaeus]|uniref:Sperm-associated antigen 5 n=1 Tax=Austrofundulus limnaeus TaxID=52670 RepID=A0A2I4B669_AUSLI|nr:PREDICTED: sperm-associated antigen 5 [Austrofundulus limnaeus]